MKSINIRNIEDLIKSYQSGEKIKYMFFWGNYPTQENVIDKSCLSQWYPAQFIVENITYKTAEHYMMAQKALLFKDLNSYYKIIYCQHPKEAKALGRKVTNFNHDIWQEKRSEIVITGNYYKFSQNPQLKDYLLDTENRVLVEASPYDKIWGIGLAESTKNIENPSTWQGLNLLGFALMEVRQLITKDLSP